MTTPFKRRKRKKCRPQVQQRSKAAVAAMSDDPVANHHSIVAKHTNALLAHAVSVKKQNADYYQNGDKWHTPRGGGR